MRCFFILLIYCSASFSFHFVLVQRVQLLNFSMLCKQFLRLLNMQFTHPGSLRSPGASRQFDHCFVQLVGTLKCQHAHAVAPATHPRANASRAFAVPLLTPCPARSVVCAAASLRSAYAPRRRVARAKEAPCATAGANASTLGRFRLVGKNTMLVQGAGPPSPLHRAWSPPTLGAHFTGALHRARYFRSGGESPSCDAFRFRSTGTGDELRSSVILRLHELHRDVTRPSGHDSVWLINWTATFAASFRSCLGTLSEFRKGRT